MSATTQPTSTSVLTFPWVRAFVAWMTADAERNVRTTTADARRELADIAAARRGDGAAYARIIERYQTAIARRMTRFARDPGAVEELTHDVFVDAYFSLPTYRGDAPLAHWLQRIATRVGYRYWKRTTNNRSVSYNEQVHDRAASDDATTRDDGEQVAQLLERLPPRDRLVLTLLYLESRSVAEAADLAGWSQTMVKVQAYRARQKFHKLYEQLRTEAPARRSSDG